MNSGEEKTRVVILTGHYRIKGNVSLVMGGRVTDYINGAKTFFAVTDAEVADLEGRQVLSTSFLNVNRDTIEIILPEG